MSQNKPSTKTVDSQRLLEEIMESQERKDPILAAKQKLLLKKLRDSQILGSQQQEPPAKLS